METLSFISAKGGSGKTILTATIANFLGNLGKRVLIVDSDGSTNGMTLFYLKEIKDYSKNINECYGILEQLFNIKSIRLTPISKNVFLLPATYEFTNTDSFDVKSFEKNLFSLIQFFKFEKKDSFDFILIDCQAGVDIHSEIVVKENISEKIIIVSEFDPISAAGIERLKGLFFKESINNRLWILFNKVLPEFANTSNLFLEITRHLPPVVWSAEVVRKYSRKELALDYEMGNEYTLNIVKILRLLFKKEVQELLNKWLVNREELIKKPIYDEYLKIQTEYEDMQKSEKAGLYSYYWPYLAAISGLISVIIFVIFNQSFNTFENSFISYKWSIVILSFLTGAFGISAIRFFAKRKDILSRNKFKKDILLERLKELEILKHSNMEKILKRYNNSLL